MAFLLQKRIQPRLLSALFNQGRRNHSLARFDWEDPVSTKSLLTSEELDIQETARSYCQERLLPRVLGK
jgi:glutaryl-CoA dehydrogenase